MTLRSSVVAIASSTVAHMSRALVTLSLVAMLASCAAVTTPAPSSTPSPSAAATPTALPIRTAAPLTPMPFATSTTSDYAVVCGTVGDFLKTTPTHDGSVVLNSPGRTPLTITLTVGRSNPEGSFANYVCVALDQGTPYPIFAGLGAPGREGYVAEGTYPATLAKPAPIGFVLPQSCAYVAPPAVDSVRTLWMVDCGADVNRDPRLVFSRAATAQGWKDCGPFLSTEILMKGTSQLRVFQSAGIGDFPRFAQYTDQAPAC